MRPSLDDYQHVAAGKVRDLYRVDDDHLLLVASDRISAFDHVLTTPIPDKGRVLTAMSVYFFTALGVPNHLAGPADDERIPDEVLGRALVVQSLRMVPIECVARGYLTGSGKVEYDATGAVSGNPLPPGLVEASQVRPPIFTPATKAAIGEHDENIDFTELTDRVGEPLAHALREHTLQIYSRASDLVRKQGLILADTKFEFGLDRHDNLVLADEVLTPDSSRYWPLDGYQPGHTQPSFDKQYVRDWLTEDSGWDRASDTPPPALPQAVVDATRNRYIEAYQRISGLPFDLWFAPEGKQAKQGKH